MSLLSLLSVLALGVGGCQALAAGKSKSEQEREARLELENQIDAALDDGGTGDGGVLKPKR